MKTLAKIIKKETKQPTRDGISPLAERYFPHVSGGDCPPGYIPGGHTQYEQAVGQPGGPNPEGGYWQSITRCISDTYPGGN